MNKEIKYYWIGYSVGVRVGMIVGYILWGI